MALDPGGDPVIGGNAANTPHGDLLIAKYSALLGVAESRVSNAHRARAARTVTAGPDFVLSVPCVGRYDVRLCDLCGRMRRQLFSGELGEGAHRFSLAGQPAGLCFVRVAAPGGRISSQTLVIVRPGAHAGLGR